MDTVDANRARFTKALNNLTKKSWTISGQGKVAASSKTSEVLIPVLAVTCHMSQGQQVETPRVLWCCLTMCKCQRYYRLSQTVAATVSSVCEGCVNGWICLAVLKRFKVLKRLEKHFISASPTHYQNTKLHTEDLCFVFKRIVLMPQNHKHSLEVKFRDWSVWQLTARFMGYTHPDKEK